MAAVPLLCILVLVSRVAVSLLLTAQQCISEQLFQIESTINNYRDVMLDRSNLPCSEPCLTLEEIEFAKDPTT